MTDRYDALVVVLKRDTREDDAKGIIDAISMMRGVAGVEPHIAEGFANIVARQRIAADLSNGILEELFRKIRG